MVVFWRKKDLSGHLEAIRDSGGTIGLVPTMGALHKGHLSLVEKAVEENDVTVVTIFVNPTQFNDPSDLEAYPRTLDQDLKILQTIKTDLVFVPSVKEMYPVENTQVFDLGGLDNVMEGKQRKGHFNGVAQIVSRLFRLTSPTRAYFGQKDFQQLVIVRHLVKILEMNIDIVGCPIVREKDGLAMSSRNVRLSREERKLSPFIYKTLKQAAAQKRTLTPAGIRSWVTEEFRKQPGIELEYFDIVEDKALRPVINWDEKVNKVGCIAVQIGGIRLIDNLNFD